MKKTLVAAVALATLLTHQHSRKLAIAPHPTRRRLRPHPHNGPVSDPDAVISNGKVIGRDPDP